MNEPQTNLSTDRPPEGNGAEAGAIIERQTAHLARIIDDLLEISRVATGRVHLRLSKVELNSVVNRATASARPLIEARNHHHAAKNEAFHSEKPLAMSRLFLTGTSRTLCRQPPLQPRSSPRDG